MMHRRYTQRHLRQNSLQRFFSNLSIVGWLIFINITFFLVAIVVSNFSPNFLKEYIALKPSNILQGQNLWTLITHMFMHAPAVIPLHLLINMFVLFNLGSLMERILGRKRFLWFYLISGIFSGLLFVLLAGFFGGSELRARIFGSPDIFAVGASGAIFAIAGLFMILLPKLKFSIIFLPFFSLPGYIMIPLVLFLMWIVSAKIGLPIGNTAHLGGLISGLVFGVWIRYKYKKKVVMLNRMFR